MKQEFRAIAMRFNEQNWKSIIGKIESAGINHHIWGDSDQHYLCNNWGGKERPYIGNCSDRHSALQTVDQVYQEWDEAVFLEACGIGQQTFTVSKEFILEAYKDACSTWKTKIEKQFKDLFPTPELEVGKWYVAYWHDVKYVVCVKSIGKDIDTYGFNITERGRYTYLPFAIDYDYKWTLATDKEVEAALIDEAKRRGFKRGVVINDIYNGKKDTDTTTVSSTNVFDYEPIPCGVLMERMALRDGKGNILFVDGKWAEIVSEPIELTLEQIAEKFGVNVEQLKIKK